MSRLFIQRKANCRYRTSCWSKWWCRGSAEGTHDHQAEARDGGRAPPWARAGRHLDTLSQPALALMGTGWTDCGAPSRGPEPGSGWRAEDEVVGTARAKAAGRSGPGDKAHGSCHSSGQTDVPPSLPLSCTVICYLPPLEAYLWGVSRSCTPDWQHRAAKLLENQRGISGTFRHWHHQTRPRADPFPQRAVLPICRDGDTGEFLQR